MRPLVTSFVFITLQAFGAVTAHADQKADTLLAEMKAAYKAAKTMTAEITFVAHAPQGSEQVDYTLILQKPDKYRVVAKTIKSKPLHSISRTDISNGKTEWSFDQIANQYTKKPSGFVLFGLSFLTPGILFFKPGALVTNPDDLKLMQTTVTTHYIGTKKLGELVCQVLVITTSNSFGGNTRELYIGPDKLVHREIVQIKSAGQPGIDEETTVTDLKINAPLTNAYFAFVPPTRAKEVKALKEVK